MKNKFKNSGKKNSAIIIATLLILSGCAGAGSKYQDSPIGSGSGPNKLKKSPCACMTLPNLGAPDGFNALNFDQTSVIG